MGTVTLLPPVCHIGAEESQAVCVSALPVLLWEQKESHRLSMSPSGGQRETLFLWKPLFVPAADSSYSFLIYFLF